MRTLRQLFLIALLAVFSGLGASVSPAVAQMKACAPASATAPLDINTATPDQLKALPGIGDAYTKRIIDGRPYTAKNQLVTRGILPQATYGKVQAMIIAKRPSK